VKRLLEQEKNVGQDFGNWLDGCSLLLVFSFYHILEYTILICIKSWH